MLNRLDVVLLSLISTRSRTGYDARKWLDRHGVYVGYSAQTSQIYRQLKQLVDKEWAFVVDDPRADVPDAKLYSITEKGSAALREWVDAPYEPVERPMEADFQVRLAFAGSNSPEKALELVQVELAYRRSQELRTFDFDESTIGDQTSDTERAWAEELFLLQNERGHLLAATFIAWLELAQKRLIRLIAVSYSATAETQEEVLHDEDHLR
jgi:DNA-binding PadR family transcriptional regulator